MASPASIGGGAAHSDRPQSRGTLVWRIRAAKATEAGSHRRTAKCGDRSGHSALRFSFRWPPDLRSPRLHGRLAAFADETTPALPTGQGFASPTEGRAPTGPPAR